MFEAWFNVFRDTGDGATHVETDTSSGDNGHPGKDIDTLMQQVVTDDGKLRVVMAS